MTDLLYIGIMFVISQPNKHVDLKNDEQTFEGILSKYRQRLNFTSSFGVCCLFKVSAAASTINQNNTYIQNPSFPTVYTGTATSLSYKVQKVAASELYTMLWYNINNI